MPPGAGQGMSDLGSWHAKTTSVVVPVTTSGQKRSLSGQQSPNSSHRASQWQPFLPTLPSRQWCLHVWLTGAGILMELGPG